MIRAARVSLVVRGRALLQDCELVLEPGRVVAVLGPNGAGKSSLLRVLAGELPASRGRVTLDDRDLSAWCTRALAWRRAVVTQFQATNLPFTVSEIVALGRAPLRARDTQATRHQAVTAALVRAGIVALADRRVDTLSGGERQRVAFARALAQLDHDSPGCWPRYLLLDEPTASLDLRHQFGVLSELRRLAAREYGVLVVLHDLNQALAYADDVVLLADGRVRAVGAARATLTPDRIAAVFGVDAVPLGTPRGDPWFAFQPRHAPASDAAARDGRAAAHAYHASDR